MTTRKPKLAPTEMEDRKVYVKPRESGPGVDIVWRVGTVINKVYRKDPAVGARYAIEQQRKLDSGASAEAVITFGDTVTAMDGGAGGAPSRELLWQAALAIAQNPGPGPRSLQAAGRAVALILGTLRKFMTAPMLVDGAEGDDDVMDDAFWASSAPFCEKWMAANGVPAEKKAVVLEVLQGGKAA